MAGRRVCVLDAGPIIHLDELGRLELLAGMGDLFVPETVAEEAEKHRAGVMGRLGVAPVPDIERVSERVLAVVADWQLQSGEAAALAWADTFGVDFIVSDDADARLGAGDLGYPSVGSLGVIRLAVEDHRLARNQAAALLQSIPGRSTLYVSARLLARVIADLP